MYFKGQYSELNFPLWWLTYRSGYVHHHIKINLSENQTNHATNVTSLEKNKTWPETNENVKAALAECD